MTHDEMSDPTPAQRRALAQIAALETEHEPANDERTSFEVEEIAVDLAEAMDEVRREPRTSLWHSFWDRLTEGGTVPGWPFEDDEPPHLVAPAPMGDRELAEERRADLAADLASLSSPLPGAGDGREHPGYRRALESVRDPGAYGGIATVGVGVHIAKPGVVDVFIQHYEEPVGYSPAEARALAWRLFVAADIAERAEEVAVDG